MKAIAKLLLPLTLFFSSCEQVIDLNLPNTQTSTLVVEGGIFHPEDGAPAIQRIKLTRTQHFFDQTETPPVTDAVVTVSDGGTDVVFNHIDDGWYVATNFTSVPGRVYTLTIEYQNEVYEAIETLPAVVAINRIYSEFEEANPIFGDEDGYAIKLDFSDPSDSPNFYYWQLQVNGGLVIEADASNSRNLVRNDDFFNGQDIIGLKTHEEFLAQVGDTTIMEQHTISSGMYDYYFALFTLTGTESLLGDPPPSPLRGNIRNLSNPDNQGLGYFQVASVSRRVLIVE